MLTEGIWTTRIRVYIVVCAPAQRIHTTAPLREMDENCTGCDAKPHSLSLSHSHSCVAHDVLVPFANQIAIIDGNNRACSREVPPEPFSRSRHRRVTQNPHPHTHTCRREYSACERASDEMRAGVSPQSRKTREAQSEFANVNKIFPLSVSQQRGDLLFK